MTGELGDPAYGRIDASATLEQKAIVSRLSLDQMRMTELAGDQIIAKLTMASRHRAPIGGLKVVTEHGWCAARPFGTEDVDTLCAERIRDADHLRRIGEATQGLIGNAPAADN